MERYQPTSNQCYAATKHERTRLNVTLFINVFITSRVALTAHNGLVAGSSAVRTNNEIDSRSKRCLRTPWALASNIGGSAFMVRAGCAHHY